ncbi:MAG: glycoside hydrolase family 2 protein [bacterium]|nr:glycoside hydrolase family 2 protein [bacterium]
MKSILSLNGKWNLRMIGENEFQTKEEYIEATVPGTVYSTLVEQGIMPDPYYRINELKATKLMDNEFEYRKHFQVNKAMLSGDELLLHFDGIDTLADIYVNETYLGFVSNMHREWEYDVSKIVKIGENEIRVHIYSPTKYIKEENEKCYTGGSLECMEGYPHLRKAHCMFGWDWGPRLPDAGIFRGVQLVSYKTAKIEDIYITQKHENGTVELSFDVKVNELKKKKTHMDDYDIMITVVSNAGETYTSKNGESIVIENPKIWWPNGYGEQPLYEVIVELMQADGVVIDQRKKQIGLRTITVRQEKDEWGTSFCHEVNGVCIFAMGADYIPEDNLLGRTNRLRTLMLLTKAKEANFNCIRVWGGGYYPDDYFFDICDELGLLVWQDFMFACSSYELDDAFEENISEEIKQNIRRIRHHASLALYCGNNEMETQMYYKVWKPSNKQYYDYIKIFEYIIPKLVKEVDPNTFYWPSSPSSGGNYDEPWDENRGDTHYWDVWHGEKPITEYRKFYFRYVSEFGFQSFPSIKTVRSFTKPEDRNILSRVMEMHQRNAMANGKIMKYISQTYLYPSSFENVIYTSQLLQMDAIRYGVEHWRRNRGRCMGAIVWQLNDIWPTASWSSIDYYGRLKALHYGEKRFFAPIIISCEEKGEISERRSCIDEPKEIEKSATLNVANETREDVTGVVMWSLRRADGSVVKRGNKQVTAPALSSVWLNKLDFSEYDELSHYVSYFFLVDGQIVSEGTSLFTAPKHFNFLDPKITYDILGNKILVHSEAYAKGVELDSAETDLVFDDNYFDMNAGTKEITVLSGIPKSLTIKSVYDIDK